MTATVKIPAMMTVSDFLDWPGDGTETRYELVDGVLRAMAAASDTHNTIYSTFLRLIGNHLEKHHPHCRVVGTPGIQPHGLAQGHLDKVAWTDRPRMEKAAQCAAFFGCQTSALRRA